jgi:hypothetical protein
MGIDIEGGKIRPPRASASLPSGKATEKLLRYETAFERQLYRAMDELERLQRRRTGEAVPAALTGELEKELGGSTLLWGVQFGNRKEVGLPRLPKRN